MRILDQRVLETNFVKKNKYSSNSLYFLRKPCWVRAKSQFSHYSYVTFSVILSEWLQLTKNSQKYFISLYTAVWFAMKTLLAPFPLVQDYITIHSHTKKLFTLLCLCLSKIRDGLLLRALNADNSEGDKIPITQPYTHLFHVFSKNKFLCQMSKWPYHGIKTREE